jgi:hypothetical protein
MKRSVLGAVKNFFGNTNSSGTTGTEFYFDSSDRLVVDEYSSSALQFALVTTQVFRDPSAFYEIQVAVDTTQATASNRVKVWVNGVQVTAFSTSTYPTQNLNTQIGTTAALGLGRNGSYTSGYYDGLITDVFFIDGQALDPTSFGETDANTGVWVPKAYSGTYGTNGFWLKFDDNSGVTATTLGKDSSGNGNNWTPNNFSVTAGTGNDSLVDSPTNYGTDTGAGGEVRGNYATLNPLATGSNGSLTNGNLDFAGPTTTYATSVATIGASSGKWYWEGTVNSAGAGFGMMSERALLSPTDLNIAGPGVSANGWHYQSNAFKLNSNSATAYGATFTTGDVIGVAMDLDAGSITFYKNGVSQGTAYSGLTTGITYFPAVGDTSSSAGGSSVNFGQRPFAYTAPSGFKALNTQNLPTPAVGASASTQAGKYFNTVLYTGTGSSLSVTGVGFQPDFTWIKGRSGATNHALYDAVRGVQKDLVSNATSAETTETTGLTAFGSDGFTVGALAKLNTSTATYVGWNWKANGAGVSNTAGTISSTVSANTTAGIAVVTYTGTGTLGTVGHGLGVAPAMIIIKGRSRVADWDIYHKSLGNGQYISLNLTGAAGSSAWLNNTSPSSTVFTVNGGTYGANFSGATTVAYCFAEVAGFSKFGSYTGNGSADGPFVYCGFRPRWILVKKSSAAGNAWSLVDTARDTYNVSQLVLRPSGSDAEVTASATPPMDILSNGFKLRSTWDDYNGSGATYIFAAFAEAPFNYARAR